MAEARIEIEVEDGAVEAFVAAPQSPGRSAAVVLLSDRAGVTPQVETQARRLSAHGFLVLAPCWTARPREDRRDDADAWMDYLADARAVDDTCVGVVGQGAGADLALRLAAWRAERITAVAAFGGRGFGPRTAREIAQRINGVVRLVHVLGVTPPRLGVLEAELAAAGVDFEVEIRAGAPQWDDVVDLFDRTIRPLRREQARVSDVHLTGHNP